MNEANDIILHLTDENCKLKLKIAELEKKLARFKGLPDPRILAIDWQYVKYIFDVQRKLRHDRPLVFGEYLEALGNALNPTLDRWKIEHNTAFDIVAKDTKENQANLA